MKNNKRVIAPALVLSLLVSNVAFAAPSDVHYKDGGLFKTATEMGLSRNLQKTVGVNPGKYVYEGQEGKLYTFDVVNKVFNNQSEDLDKTLENLEKEESVGEVVEGELKVTKVSAITESAFVGDVELKFAINGETKAADLKAVQEAGYIVKFLGSKSVGAKGKITLGENDKFSYKVVVEKDGEVVAESEEVSVKVSKANDPAKITKHEIVKSGLVVETLVVGDLGYEVIIKEYESLEGKTEKNSITGLKYKSSNEDVVYVDSKGKLTPLTEGTATISITKDQMTEYKIPVTVKAEARKAAKATAKDIKLSTADNEAIVEVVVVDQYGDPVEGGFTVDANKDLVTETELETATDGKGTIKVNASADKLDTGAYTVSIKNDKEVTLGSFTVNFEKADKDNIVKYEFRTDSENNVIDHNVVKDKTKQKLELEVIGKDKDGVVADIATIEKNSEYKVTFTNDEVFNITIEGNKDEIVDVEVDEGKKLVFEASKGDAGKAGKVTAVLKKGDLKRDSYEVVVKNTTKPAIKDNKVNVNDKVIAVKDNVIIVEYNSKSDSIGYGKIEFNNAVKVESIEANGKSISGANLAKLISKTGIDFRLESSDEIEITEDNAIATEIGDLLEITKEVKVNVVNDSGLKEIFTIKFVVADAE